MKDRQARTAESTSDAGQTSVLDLKTLQRLNQFIGSTEQMQNVTHNSCYTRETVVGDKANQHRLFRELVEINDDLLA